MILQVTTDSQDVSQRCPQQQQESCPSRPHVAYFSGSGMSLFQSTNIANWHADGNRNHKWSDLLAAEKFLKLYLRSARPCPSSVWSRREQIDKSHVVPAFLSFSVTENILIHRFSPSHDRLRRLFGRLSLIGGLVRIGANILSASRSRRVVYSRRRAGQSVFNCRCNLITNGIRRGTKQ